MIDPNGFRLEYEPRLRWKRWKITHPSFLDIWWYWTERGAKHALRRWRTAAIRGRV